MSAACCSPEARRTSRPFALTSRRCSAPNASSNETPSLPWCTGLASAPSSSGALTLCRLERTNRHDHRGRLLLGPVEENDDAEQQRRAHDLEREKRLVETDD